MRIYLYCIGGIGDGGCQLQSMNDEPYGGFPDGVCEDQCGIIFDA